MKKISVIVLVLVNCLILASCTKGSINVAETVDEILPKSKYGFTTLYDGYSYQVIYANDTNVMYLQWHSISTTGYAGYGGITPLYNPDGTLQIFIPEAEKK